MFYYQKYILRFASNLYPWQNSGDIFSLKFNTQACGLSTVFLG